ncbi:MAG: glycosyltransferase [Gammaproteobacteria bacterium]|nr:glycosyltransferase [Gammaproteobacteria bacterium]
MRIAIFAGEFPTLSETFVLRQVVGLLRQGHDVTVITCDAGDPQCQHQLYTSNNIATRIKVIRPMQPRWRTLLSIGHLVVGAVVSRHQRGALTATISAVTHGSMASILDISTTSSAQSLGQYDAIVAHFGPIGVRAMFLQQAGLLCGPLAVIFHGLDMSDYSVIESHRRSYRKLFIHAAQLLPISRLWASRLTEWGAEPSKVRVLRMGVDVEDFQVRDQSRPPLATNVVNALAVARLTEKKGIEYAIKGVAAARCEVRLSIIGSGPLESSLRQMVIDLGCEDKVQFLGRRPQQEVFAELDRSDLFILPSVVAASGDMEGIPVALMEAMAKGVLVLATRHSGIPELIEHGVSGLLVPERDAVAIGDTLERLVAGEWDLVAMRTQARAAVEREFNNAMLDQQLVSICQQMAGG